MLKLVLALLLVTAGLAQAADERRTRILDIVEEELKEVIRLSKQRDDGDPELLLRISGLQLERARLQRELENEKFLSIPADQRRGLDEERYYASSTKSFTIANQYATAVVKRFPKYKDIADVYYVLAFNYRELKDYKSSEKYFTLAQKNARAGTDTYYKSRLALAEQYYNKNDYKKAAPLYEEALGHIDNTWWTKDAFNMAWSHYRNKNFSRAIELMKEIHRKSGSNKYINMRYYVERDLGLFYVDAKRTNEAVAWYKEQGIDFSGHLTKIAKGLIPQGKFTQAEALLNQAAAIQKDPANRAELLVMQMDLFDKYEKIPQHLKAAEELTVMAEQNKLNEEQLKHLEYQVGKKAAELQKSAASNLYKDVEKVRNLRAKRANKYFALLARLKPNASAESSFYQGETLFAVGNFSEALAAYQRAQKAAVAEKNAKVQKQAMEGMLAALGQKGIAAATLEPYYVPVYEAYIQQDPRSERSKVIRQKLYKVHMERKNLDQAEKTMKEYAAAFPDDYKTQEAMLAGIMEEYRKQKDYTRVKGYVAQINDGTYKVSKKYAEALRQMMTKIQIEDAQSSLNKGDKAKALQGYLRIYKNPESTPRAKANASYNLAALYYELGQLPESYSWSVTALKDMDDKEARQFADSFLAISTNLFLRQRFQQSADLGMRTVAKLCGQGVAAKNTAFKNAAFLWLAEGKIEKAEETLDLGLKCGIDVAPQNEVRLELAKEYQKQKRWESLEGVLGPVLTSSAQAPLALPYLFQLRTVYSGINEGSKVAEKDRQIRDVYQAARAKNVDVPVEALDLIALQMANTLENKKRQLASVPLGFPEQKFNQTVKAKLATLDGMTNDIQEIQKTGSGRGIVKAYRILISSYEDFAQGLQSFNPEGKSPEYVASFSKAMSSVWGPILQSAQKRRAEVAELIKKNTILSTENFALLVPGNTKPVVRYRRQVDMVLMDRGGRR